MTKQSSNSNIQLQLKFSTIKPSRKNKNREKYYWNNNTEDALKMTNLSTMKRNHHTSSHQLTWRKRSRSSETRKKAHSSKSTFMMLNKHCALQVYWRSPASLIQLTTKYAKVWFVTIAKMNKTRTGSILRSIRLTFKLTSCTSHSGDHNQVYRKQA